MKAAPTPEQLADILNSPTTTPEEKGWNIYRYMSAAFQAASRPGASPQLSSVEARNLLQTYLKLGAPKPSLLHSRMLGVALKMAEAYTDFRLPAFLNLWGPGNLRPDDMQPYRAADGHTFSAPVQRLAAALVRYSVKHPDDPVEPRLAEWAARLTADSGYLPVRDMVAVKIFEAERERRKIRMVKLVGTDGMELSADWHAFNAKPWEIAGKMYTVLPRRSEKTDNIRVDTIALSPNDVGETFGKVIGYVDRYDSAHKHYHIFDNQSRHFVAESPRVRIDAGGFVWFAPVVPAEDKFKTAVVIAAETQERGSEAFGVTQARVTFVNSEKGYLTYVTQDGRRGSVDLTLVARAAIGQELRLITYMRRGRDGQKHLHTAIVL